MNTPDAVPLEALVDAAILRVASFPLDAVFEAAQGATTLLYGPDAQTSAEHRRPFKDVYASADALRRDLDARAPAIKGGVVALLAALDPDAAAIFVASVLPHKLEAFGFGTWQADLWYALWVVLPALAPRIPLAMLVELSMQRRIPANYQRPGMFGAIPLEEIARAVRNERVLDPYVDKLFAEHEALRDAPTVLALLEQRAVGADSALQKALVERLGALRYTPAIPYLAKVAADSLARGLAGCAITALHRMGDPDARRVLVDALPAILDGKQGSGGAVRAALAAALEHDPARSTETLSAYFTDAALGTNEGRARVARMWGELSAPGEALDFASDPRWPEVAARLLNGPLFDSARCFLAIFDPKLVRAALKQAGYVAPRPPAPRVHPVPKHPGWLARYESGEHQAVWDEIVALEDSAQDPAIVEEATAVARAMMARVRTNLEQIVALLKKRKYAFAAKSVKKALAAPEAKAATQMAALEKIAGASLPLSLRAFWEVVGSVDLTELDAANQSAEGLGECDPLMIEPPKLPLSLLKERADFEKRLPAELRRTIRVVVVGLDPTNKFDADDSNNDPYEIELTGTRADALILQGSRALPFVEYLRAVIARGGFYAAPPDDERKDDALAALAVLKQGRIAF